ncbi:hypothetical protein [Aquibacillus saliphilus]|uniref:hypothetical protein n=1 Tax=Aquibacillus saliphilus TaxID=1909422 RepID=UPI001CF00278|nr:hypothetical protein [Aquibacillus saliphilus]
MDELLSQYIENFNGTSTTIDGFKGYINGNNGFFIITDSNNEEVHYEQKAISDFLIYNGVRNIATPLFNRQGQLITTIDNRNYIVCNGTMSENKRDSPSARQLASFHKIGAGYPYEPNYVSSYGQWKGLWAKKIADFEHMYTNYYDERPVSRYRRLFIDTFPYLVGLSENAIQFLQEAETDGRFHTIDRPAITFQRYHYQLQQQIIWSHDLVHDHPVRDLAEYIRPILLEEDKPFTKVETFLKEYESVQSLSIFSWRLLYARLLFPIHLFDFLEVGVNMNDQEALYRQYKILLEKQYYYERNLRNFFSELDLDTQSVNISVIEW